MAKDDVGRPAEEEKEGKTNNQVVAEITEAEIIAAMSWQRDSGRLSRPASTQRLHNVIGEPTPSAQGSGVSDEEEETNAEQSKGRGRPRTGLTVPPASKSDKKNLQGITCKTENMSQQRHQDVGTFVVGRYP